MGLCFEEKPLSNYKTDSVADYKTYFDNTSPKDFVISILPLQARVKS